MRYIIGAIAAVLLLSGCGGFQESLSSKQAFDIILEDGRNVQCVQVTGHNGSVAVVCDFAGAQ